MKTQMHCEEISLPDTVRALDLITDLMVGNKVPFTDGYVAMSMILYLSGKKEMFDFLAVQVMRELDQKKQQNAATSAVVQ